MNLSKSKKYSIFTLALVFLVAVFTAVGLIVSEYVALAADYRDITLTGSNYFYTSNNAKVDAYTDSSSTEYQSFVFSSDSDYVTYRKNLAYKWYADDEDTESTTYGDVQEGYFSLTIGFESLTFDTFTIKFQSQQYTLTEDEVTTNYITFVAGTNCVYVITSTEDPLDYDEEEDDVDLVADAVNRLAFTGYSKITLTFGAPSRGVYPLTIEDNDGITSASDTAYTYQLENIGSSYAKYVSSSSSNSVIPLTFSAEGVSDSGTEMVLYSLNGQSFQLYDTEYEDDGTYVTGEVHDDADPVLCLDDDFTTVRYGYSLELNYAVIDVLATSPRTTINYYILTTGQAEQAATDNLNLESSDTVEYISVSTSDTYAFIEPSDYYKGFTDTDTESYTTKCLVKIYLTITDSTASGGQSDDVFLDWYVEGYADGSTDYLVDIEGYKFIRAVEDNRGASYSFQPVYEDESGATYTCDKVTYTYTDDAGVEQVYDLAAIEEEYQAEVTAEAKKQEITAGDSNYFYIPSFEGYVSDNLTGYQDLTYSIYYIAGSSTSVSSNTGLDYNELSITLSEEGKYRFAIFVTDSNSNDMWYWGYNESSAEWERCYFDADDLSDMLTDADSVLWKYVPTFTFEVTYEGLVVEDPIAQDICYVDNEYTAASFDITGLNSGYSASYTLYVFDREAYSNDYDTTISYSQMIEQIATIFENGELRAKYFTLIKALADMEETDEDYDTYCDYEWDPDSLSFIPQDENTFYIIRLVVTDTTLLTAKTTSYMVISSSASAAELSGESEWVQDNIASIILLSVAGAALIGIVLLIVIRPKETDDIDIIDMNEEENRKSPRKKIKKDQDKE